MSEDRFGALVGRLLRPAALSGWHFDRCLEALAVECDEAQWARLCRVLGRRGLWR